MPSALARQVFHAAQLSLGQGMRAVLYAMAGVMLVAAIVAARGLRRGIHAAPDTQAGPTAAADEKAAVPGTEGIGGDVVPRPGS